MCVFFVLMAPGTCCHFIASALDASEVFFVLEGRFSLLVRASTWRIVVERVIAARPAADCVMGLSGYCGCTMEPPSHRIYFTDGELGFGARNTITLTYYPFPDPLRIFAAAMVQPQQCYTSYTLGNIAFWPVHR